MGILARMSRNKLFYQNKFWISKNILTFLFTLLYFFWRNCPAVHKATGLKNYPWTLSEKYIAELSKLSHLQFTLRKPSQEASKNSLKSSYTNVLMYNSTDSGIIWLATKKTGKSFKGGHYPLPLLSKTVCQPNYCQCPETWSFTIRKAGAVSVRRRFQHGLVPSSRCLWVGLISLLAQMKGILKVHRSFPFCWFQPLPEQEVRPLSPLWSQMQTPDINTPSTISHWFPAIRVLDPQDLP